MPEYTKVPSKDSPFDESFYANTHISSNNYPAALDVISGVPQSEKTSSLYFRHKTGKVCACFVFASTSKVTAMFFLPGYVHWTRHACQLLPRTFLSLWVNLGWTVGCGSLAREVQNRRSSHFVIHFIVVIAKVPPLYYAYKNSFMSVWQGLALSIAVSQETLQIELCYKSSWKKLLRALVLMADWWYGCTNFWTFVKHFSENNYLHLCL